MPMQQQKNGISLTTETGRQQAEWHADESERWREIQFIFNARNRPVNKPNEWLVDFAAAPIKIERKKKCKNKSENRRESRVCVCWLRSVMLTLSLLSN